MATRATGPRKKPTVRVATKQSPKTAAQPKDPGTNGPILADRETFHFHVGIIRRQQDKVVAERKFLKDARRKASDAGINLGDLDLAMRMSEQEPETVQESIKRMATYAHWMGLAPGVQADLFETADSRKGEEARAEDEGYVEGLEGKTAEGERYDTGNPIGQARLKGWYRGQEIVKARFMNGQKEPATPQQDETAAEDAEQDAEKEAAE